MSTAFRFSNLIRKSHLAATTCTGQTGSSITKHELYNHELGSFSTVKIFAHTSMSRVLNNLIRCNDCQSVENWCLAGQCGAHLNANVYNENDGDR